jgi:hypothetical protein
VAGQIEIVNRALFKLGALPLASMGDNNKQARIMSGLWDTVRRAELRRHFWSFALRRAALPALAQAPAWGYARAYQLPADCLRIAQVGELQVSPSEADYRNMDDSPYAIEGGMLLTDQPAPLRIRYVADVSDPGAFDALFVEALAAKLAYEACEGITQANEKKNVCSEDYKAAIRAASLVNAIEKPSQGIADDAWITTRL